MSKVMIHPATYETFRQAVDRAFDLFPLKNRTLPLLEAPFLTQKEKSIRSKTRSQAIYMKTLVERSGLSNGVKESGFQEPSLSYLTASAPALATWPS